MTEIATISKMDLWLYLDRVNVILSKIEDQDSKNEFLNLMTKSIGEI